MTTAMPGTAPSTAKRRWPLIALLAANVISETGNRITTLAIPWYVLSGGGSGLQVGLVGFFNLVPTVLVAFLGRRACRPVRRPPDQRRR